MRYEAGGEGEFIMFFWDSVSALRSWRRRRIYYVFLGLCECATELEGKENLLCFFFCLRLQQEALSRHCKDF